MATSPRIKAVQGLIDANGVTRDQAMQKYGLTPEDADWMSGNLGMKFASAPKPVITPVQPAALMDAQSVKTGMTGGEAAKYPAPTAGASTAALPIANKVGGPVQSAMTTAASAPVPAAVRMPPVGPAPIPSGTLTQRATQAATKNTAPGMEASRPPAVGTMDPAKVTAMDQMQAAYTAAKAKNNPSATITGAPTPGDTATTGPQAAAGRLATTPATNGTAATATNAAATSTATTTTTPPPPPPPAPAPAGPLVPPITPSTTVTPEADVAKPVVQPPTAMWRPGKNATVQGQIAKIVDKDSELMQMAATQGLQSANAKGLANSSMGVQATQAALYNAAMPMATQDANTFATAGQFNANEKNDRNALNAQLRTDVNKFNASESNAIIKLGMDNDTRRDLANTEANYKVLMQTSATAGDLYKTYMASIATILQSKDMDATSKQNAINTLMSGLNSSLDVAGGMANIDMPDLEFDTDATYGTAVNGFPLPNVISGIGEISWTFKGRNGESLADIYNAYATKTGKSALSPEAWYLDRIKQAPGPGTEPPPGGDGGASAPGGGGVDGSGPGP